MVTRVRVVSLRSFDPDVANLSPRAFRAWARGIDWACLRCEDGILTPSDIESIGAKPADLKELREAGVWQTDEDGRTFIRELREGPPVIDVEGSEVEHEKPLPLTAAERAKRYRQKKSNTASRDVVTLRDELRDEPSRECVTKSDVRDVTSVTNGSSLSDLKSLPDPDSPSVLASDSKLLGSARDSEKPANGRQGKHRMPKDFPSDEERKELMKYGRKKGLRDGQTEGQIEACQLWAWGSGTPKLDWFATCQGFIRSFASDERRPPGAVQHEQRKAEEATRRPYHELFEDKPIEGKASPAEALEAIQKQFPGLGRRIPA